MRFSSYRRRAPKSGTARVLSRIAARLAPTDYQRARALKQGIRAAGRAQDPQYVRGLAAFKQQWNSANPANPIDDTRAMKLYGRGGYWGNMIGGWLGGLTGNERMKSWGASLGDQFGDAVGAYIPGGNQMAAGAEAAHRAYLSGSGAYSMNTDMTPSPQVGSFAQGEVDSIRIRKREYLGAIKGSVGLVLKTLLINAGESATFPTLSRIAMQYEQYKMNGLVFWFKSTSGESSASGDTAIGEIIMTAIPDSSEPTPQTKAQLVNTDGSVQNKPSLSSCFGFECADIPVLKIRHGDPNESADSATLFDAGRFFLATEGMNADTTRVGELWVTYDCTLIRSRDPRGLETIGYKAYFPNTDRSNILGAAKFVRLNSLRMTCTGLTLSFPQFVNDGTFIVMMKLIGVPNASATDAISHQAPYWVSTAGCQVLEQRIDSNAAIAHVTANNMTDGIAFGYYVIRVNAPDSAIASITFGANGTWQLATGGGAATGPLDLEVYRVPDVAFP